MVPLLITEILADMTEAEAKAEGFTILEEFHKEYPKTTKQPTRPRRNRDSLRIPQNRKATRTEYNNKRNAK